MAMSISKSIQQIRSPTLNLKLTLSVPPPLSLEDDDQPMALMMVQEPEPVLAINNVNDILPIMAAPAKKRRRSPNKQKSSSELIPKKKTEKFVDEGDTIIDSVVEHVKSRFGYNEVKDAKIIMEKKITASDMKDFQGRLAIPTSKDNLIAPFLTRDEEELLNSKDGAIKKMNMNVKVIAGMSEYEMPLARWDYHHLNKETKNNNNNNNNNNNVGYKYVLKNGRSGAWTKLRKEEGLQEDDYILIATFRHNDALHFVIVKEKPVMLFGRVIGHKYSLN